MISSQTTHFVKIDVLREWCTDHGIDFDTLLSASIRLDLPTTAGHPMWLDVTFWKKDERGRAYAVVDKESGKQVQATGSATVPLHSWPDLVEVRPPGDV